MRRSSTSTNAIYKEAPIVVMRRFQEDHPNYRGLNVLKMRAILAGEVTLVDISGTRKFELWFTSELPELDRLNKKIRVQNRIIRARNKQFRMDMEARLAKDPVWGSVIETMKKYGGTR